MPQTNDTERDCLKYFLSEIKFKYDDSNQKSRVYFDSYLKNPLNDNSNFGSAKVRSCNSLNERDHLIKNKNVS